MSGFPGAGHHAGNSGGGGYPYGQQPPGPPQAYYPDLQYQQYQQYPPPAGQPPYHQQQGYGVPPPQNYAYEASPPPQQYPSPHYGVPAYPPPLDNSGYGAPAYPPPDYPPHQGYPPTGTYPPSNIPGPTYGHTEGQRPPMPTVTNNSYRHGNLNAPPPPPTGPQSFGIPNYQWVPSKCTGRRKALLIGINYFGQAGQLRGCINDVKNMSAFLNERFGYAKEDMVILTDDQQNPRSIPNKANILQAMHWLVKDARPDDSLFFHYSGHGGQTKDLDGDENDGNDETIFPVDFRFAGQIVDDEMHRIMVMPLQPGVRLTAIFDSCHSGSVLDLPYLYSTQGLLKEPNIVKEAGTGLLNALMSYGKGDVSGAGSSVMGIFTKATTGRNAQEKSIRTKTSPADVIQWSGSKDIQTSADAVENGQATGAMSYAFITALKNNPQQSYQQLLNSIRQELEGKYDQKPQLSCSHPLGDYDTDPFFF